MLRCQKCTEELTWEPVEADPTHRRRTLRCPKCQTEHALARGERPVPVLEAPFGVCACPACPQKSLLIWQDEQLVCPVSGEAYTRQQGQPPTRIRELPFGVCTCCGREAQPLLRAEGGHIICPKTGREHTIRDGRYQAINAAVGDVDAINRALLAGTLSLTQSGLPVDGEGDDVL